MRRLAGNVQTTATVRVQDAGTTRARARVDKASVPRPVLEPALANPQPDRGNHHSPEAKLD